MIVKRLVRTLATYQHALENYFSFGSGGSYEDYKRIDRWVIKTDIDANRPVIFRGCEERSTF